METSEQREYVEPTLAHLEQALTAIGSILETLEKPSEPRQADYVDYALHFALCGSGPCGLGQEAMRRINDEFVDRNELRVTEAFEIEDLLEDLEITDRFERASQVRGVVADVYNDQNSVSLAFLRDATVADRHSFFQRVPAIDATLAAVLGNVIDWDDVLFSGRSTQRVQTRLGLDPKDEKVVALLARGTEMLTPWGHLPILVGPHGKGGKPVLEPALSPAAILLRLSPAPKVRKRS